MIAGVVVALAALALYQSAPQPSLGVATAQSAPQPVILPAPASVEREAPFARETPADAAARWHLHGVMTSTRPEQSRANLSAGRGGESAGQWYANGARLEEGVRLGAIAADHVIIEDHGRPLRIPLRGAAHIEPALTAAPEARIMVDTYQIEQLTAAMVEQFDDLGPARRDSQPLPAEPPRVSVGSLTLTPSISTTV